jgi:colicin import membrane protein
MALINFEAVATAAEKLQAAGQRASVRAVMDEIGGGSPNSVLKLLNEWKAGRPVVRVADAALDGKITTAIVEQMQRVATAAAAAAEERAASLSEDLQTMTDANAAAEHEIAALASKLDASQKHVATLETQLKDSTEEAHRVAEQNINLVASLRQDTAAERQRLEVATTELARAEVRLEALPGLHAEVAQLRAQLDASQQARVVAEQAAAVAAARLDERATKAQHKATVKAPGKMID